MGIVFKCCHCGRDASITGCQCGHYHCPNCTAQDTSYVGHYRKRENRILMIAGILSEVKPQGANTKTAQTNYQCHKHSAFTYHLAGPLIRSLFQIRGTPPCLPLHSGLNLSGLFSCLDSEYCYVRGSGRLFGWLVLVPWVLISGCMPAIFRIHFSLVIVDIPLLR